MPGIKTPEQIEEEGDAASKATIANTPVFSRSELMSKLVNYALNCDKETLAQSVQDITKADVHTSQTVSSDAGNKSTIEGRGKALTSAVKEDLTLALEGEELSEEFKEKASTLFEVAVSTRVEIIKSELEESFKTNLETALEEAKVEMAEKVEMFLEHIGNEWLEDNKVAVTSSIKTEMAESFIEGLKEVFTEHYIDIPDDKVDIVEAMEQRISELEEISNQKIQEAIEQSRVIEGLKKESAVAEMSESLTATQKAKFASLVEGMSYDNLEDLKNKMVIIRESHFKVASQKGEPSIITESAPEEVIPGKPKTIDPTMAAYVAALERTT